MRVLQTEEFARWLKGLKDAQAARRIAYLITRMEVTSQLPADTKMLSPELREIRCHFGPGYRLYFTQKNNTLVILLAGGDKSTQSRDIFRAKRILTQWKEQ